VTDVSNILYLVEILRVICYTKYSILKTLHQFNFFNFSVLTLFPKNQTYLVSTAKSYFLQIWHFILMKLSDKL